jgi:hypothetical protein
MHTQRSLLTLLLLTVLCTCGRAQVVINEFSAANLDSFTDVFDKTEDWIELYNTGAEAVALGGWHLSDKENKPGKYEIPAGTTIPAGGHLLFICSGRDLVKDGQFHTNFKLTQTKANEVVLLSNPAESILEMHAIGFNLVEHAHARVTDGAAEWKVATVPTFGTSNNGAPLINGYTAAPTMDLAAGFYDTTQTVTITNTEANSVLRYTLDGTNPTELSPLYTTPITVEATTVVKARAFSNDADILPGKLDFNTYFINEDYSLAVFSVAADSVLDLAAGFGDVIPIGSLEYFNIDKEREATSFGSLNRHGQDSWVLDHRSLDWVSRDEMGYSKAVEAPLFKNSDRDEYQKFMFRNSGDDNYPAIEDGQHEGATHIRDEYVQTLAVEGGMELDSRIVERVILFLNGKYWGVYGMRERPVDHDYTDEYYDQGKYEIQYLTTWGTTELQYGGEQALTDWQNLRDFILENDMSVEENYETVDDSLNLTSLTDYMLVNLNTVAIDWLNYNTGWWRGRNPEGKHKKWGYILWDLDATFGYYINYTGVPNEGPEALVCDIEEIAVSVDEFFNGTDQDSVDVSSCATIINGTAPYPVTDSIQAYVLETDNFCCNGEWDATCQGSYDETLEYVNNGGLLSDLNVSEPDTIVADSCQTIINGTAPYPVTDSIQTYVFQADGFCCGVEWDGTCQDQYNVILEYVNDGGALEDLGGQGPLVPGGEIAGNVGKHEQIFLKLIEESSEFRQLYYGRYADMMNTTFSCENMNYKLDSMLATIEPEMPRQIERWGGTLEEWQRNVLELKAFINERCNGLAANLPACYNELNGPYEVTLLTEPNGIGEIDFNTLDIEAFPWSGDYYGGMRNKIKAKVFDEFEGEYVFSHWESRSGNVIFPDSLTRKAEVELTAADTLVAVFSTISSTDDFATRHAVEVFPNPTSGAITLSYQLGEPASVELALYSVLGRKIKNFPLASGFQNAGGQRADFSFDAGTPNGLYLLKLRIGAEQRVFKINLVR